MFNFFHNLTVGFVSAWAAFTGAFHSQSAPAPVQTPMVSTEVQVSASTSLPTTETISTPIQQAKVTTQNTVSAPNIQTTPNVVVTTPVSMPTPAPTPSSSSVSPADYSLYSVVPSDFTKNIPHYIGTEMKIGGNITDFLANGDRGVNSNYIEVEPYSSNAPSRMMFEIDSAANYQNAVATLDTSDYVVAYGTIIASQNFTNAYGIVSLIPVLDVTRLDKCDGSSYCGLIVGAQTIFPQLAVQDMNSGNSNFRSITDIWKNGAYGGAVTTQGKIRQIVPNTNGGSSLLLLDDPKQSSGSVAVEVTNAFLVSNKVKVGTTLNISGTLPSLSNEGSLLYDYGYIGQAYIITDGTVSVN